METLTYRIRGMDCAEEVAALKAELEPLAGLEDIGFDLLNGKITVTAAKGTVKPDDIVAAVARAGLKAEPWQDLEQAQPPDGWSRWGRTVMTTASGALVLLGFVSHGLLAGFRAAVGAGDELTVPLASRVFYILAVLSGAWYVAPKAWLALLRLRPDMNLLMTVAVAGALLIGEYFEAGTVAFLFALSLALEAWSVGRARRAITALMAMSPATGRVLCPDGREELVEVTEIPVGSTLVVRPGDKFPLDGRITRGDTTVNQAPITGESLPVPKSVGDEVFAGTINEDGAVEFVSIRPAADTTLARIIRMVGEAHSKRAPSEQWVESFARYYTPAVMALAFGVMVVPPVLLGATWASWFYQGLVLLVIACPCALVISTPISIVAALTSAARAGVLIKGGPFVELPARLAAIAFDKTGTLTTGHPEVRQVVPLGGHGEREVLELAAAIELRSEHPLARAVVRYADARGIRPAAAEDFQAIRGKGVVAAVAGRPVWLGSHRYLQERRGETPEVAHLLQALSSDGSSVVVVGRENEVWGLLAVGDAIRPDARKTIADLKAAGLKHVMMLTGDNRGTAEAVAVETGVDDVKAELLPEDKVAAVEALVNRYGQVAMVGDGVNDAPAMARASLAIAMGAVGTDAALETADIALMSDDLSRLPWIVRHARRTLRIIRQNVIASLAVKAVFVLLAFGGVASLWTAIAADMGTSLLVVFNALRLLGGHSLADKAGPA